MGENNPRSLSMSVQCQNCSAPSAGDETGACGQHLPTALQKSPQPGSLPPYTSNSGIARNCEDLLSAPGTATARPVPGGSRSCYDTRPGRDAADQCDAKPGLWASRVRWHMDHTT